MSEGRENMNWTQVTVRFDDDQLETLTRFQELMNGPYSTCSRAHAVRIALAVALKAVEKGKTDD